MVAAATHSLCEAANAMVQGHASEEKLIASAKEVAGSTAQLLMACKVKADPGSVAMQRLQVSGQGQVWHAFVFGLMPGEPHQIRSGWGWGTVAGNKSARLSE